MPTPPTTKQGRVRVPLGRDDGVAVGGAASAKRAHEENGDWCASRNEMTGRRWSKRVGANDGYARQ